MDFVYFLSSIFFLSYVRIFGVSRFYLENVSTI